MKKLFNSCHSHENGNPVKRHGRDIIASFCAADAAFWIPAFAGMTMIFLSGCGCALDSGEQKNSSYISGCWDHLWQDKEAKEGKF